MAASDMATVINNFRSLRIQDMKQFGNYKTMLPTHIMTVQLLCVIMRVSYNYYDNYYT